MRKLAVLAVAIIVLATIGASYQLSANLVKTSNVVKIGYIPLALSLPVFVAEENGYFGSEGVKYELVEMESTDSILKALVNNEIDAAFEVSLAPVLAFEEKNPNSIKIFSVSSLTTDKPVKNNVESARKLSTLVQPILNLILTESPSGVLNLNAMADILSPSTNPISLNSLARKINCFLLDCPILTAPGAQ